MAISNPKIRIELWKSDQKEPNYLYYVESRNFISCMYTFEFIHKNTEHLDGLPKRPQNPDCEVEKVYSKFWHVPVYIYKEVLPLNIDDKMFFPQIFYLAYGGNLLGEGCCRLA